MKIEKLINGVNVSKFTHRRWREDTQERLDFIVKTFKSNNIGETFKILEVLRINSPLLESRFKDWAM